MNVAIVVIGTHFTVLMSGGKDTQKTKSSRISTDSCCALCEILQYSVIPCHPALLVHFALLVSDMLGWVFGFSCALNITG